MALSASRRRRIPASKFVYPPGSKIGGKSGKYPVDTPARARAALRYAGKSSTAGSYSTVARKVRAVHGKAVPAAAKKTGYAKRK